MIKFSIELAFRKVEQISVLPAIIIGKQKDEFELTMGIYKWYFEITINW